jgi:hypothetical protein
MNNGKDQTQSLGIDGCEMRQEVGVCMIRRFIYFFVLSICIFFLLVSPEEGKAQTSYECVCRGGGSLYFNYTPFSNFWSQPQIWVDQISRGPSAVGRDWQNRHSLQPGQCAWLDRGMEPSEPNRIVIPVNVNQFSISWHQGRVMGISSELYYINNLQDSNKFQSFFVYNDRRGNFIVTQIGSMR